MQNFNSGREHSANYTSKNKGGVERTDDEEELEVGSDYTEMLKQLDVGLKKELFPRFGIDEKLFKEVDYEQIKEKLVVGNEKNCVNEGTEEQEVELFSQINAEEFEEESLEGLHLWVRSCCSHLEQKIKSQ